MCLFAFLWLLATDALKLRLRPSTIKRWRYRTRRLSCLFWSQEPPIVSWWAWRQRLRQLVRDMECLWQCLAKHVSLQRLCCLKPSQLCTCILRGRSCLGTFGSINKGNDMLSAIMPTLQRHLGLCIFRRSRSLLNHSRAELISGSVGTSSQSIPAVYHYSTCRIWS